MRPGRTDDGAGLGEVVPRGDVDEREVVGEREVVDIVGARLGQRAQRDEVSRA